MVTIWRDMARIVSASLFINRVVRGHGLDVIMVRIPGDGLDATIRIWKESPRVGLAFDFQGDLALAVDAEYGGEEICVGAGRRGRVGESEHAVALHGDEARLLAGNEEVVEAVGSV